MLDQARVCQLQYPMNTEFIYLQVSMSTLYSVSFLNLPLVNLRQTSSLQVCDVVDELSPLLKIILAYLLSRQLLTS